MAMCIELLEQRVAQLETQQRRWKYRFFVLSLVTFSGVLLGAGVSRTGKFDQLTVDKLTARSIELKDAEGRMTHVMGSLSKHSDYSIKGSSRLEVYPGPYFYMYDPSGKHRTFRINQGYRGQLALRMSSPTKPYDFNVVANSREGQGAISLFSLYSDNRGGVADMTASRSSAVVTVEANGKRLTLNAAPDRLGGTNLNLGGPGIKEQYWPQR